MCRQGQRTLYTALVALRDLKVNIILIYIYYKYLLYSSVKGPECIYQYLDFLISECFSKIVCSV